MTAAIVLRAVSKPLASVFVAGARAGRSVAGIRLRARRPMAK
jgi:hypothetical protein